MYPPILIPTDNLHPAFLFEIGFEYSSLVFLIYQMVSIYGFVSHDGVIGLFQLHFGCLKDLGKHHYFTSFKNSHSTNSKCFSIVVLYVIEHNMPVLSLRGLRGPVTSLDKRAQQAPSVRSLSMSLSSTDTYPDPDALHFWLLSFFLFFSMFGE